MVKHVSLWMMIMLAVVPVLGQESREQIPVIEYGQRVTDTLSNENFEISYRFSGTEGDITVFELYPTESLSTLEKPELVLFNQENQIIQNTAEYFNFREAIMVVELPGSWRYWGGKRFSGTNWAPIL